MVFSTDKQTIKDLEIFGYPGRNSVYNLFNLTTTRAGASILEEMFRYPLSSVEAINKRSHILKYFQVKNLQFPFQPSSFIGAQQYLADTDERTKLSTEDKSFGKKLALLITDDAKYRAIQDGVMAI